VQAIPLVASARLGHCCSVTSIRADRLDPRGAIPGVYLGARVSSRAPDGILRPFLVLALTSSALKLLGASNTVLAIGVGVVVVLLLHAGPARSAPRARAPRRLTRDGRLRAGRLLSEGGRPQGVTYMRNWLPMQPD